MSRPHSAAPARANPLLGAGDAGRAFHGAGTLTIFLTSVTFLVGVGGGFALVPALVLLAKVPMKQAVGTFLLVIVANSVTGFLGYLGYVELDWHLVISFIFAASLGTTPGAKATKNLWIFSAGIPISHPLFCEGKLPELIAR